jgi:hypothetical protein
LACAFKRCAVIAAHADVAAVARLMIEEFSPPPVTPSEVRNRSPRAAGGFEESKKIKE